MKITLRNVWGLALLTLALTTFAQPEKLIEELTITKNRLEVKINKEFKKAYLKDDFFIEYDENIDLTKLDYSIVTLPFIMNVISLVWISGKDYSIDSMDQGVYDSLERLKKLFRFFYPKTEWNGRLIPKKIVNAPQVKPYSEDSDGKIALLFSGGVDSVSASFAHRDKQQLLITAWGQSCLPLDHPELWNVIKNHVTDFAKSYGHENSFIKSNYYYFLDFKKLCTLSPEIATWRIDTIEDIGWAGLVAPILVTKGIPTLHIASSDTWDFFYPSATNPFIDGNISFAGLKFKHDQFEMSRFDKIASIHNLCHRHLVEKPQLIICQQKGGIINCGSCEKCCCTLLGLLAAGADPREYGYAIGPKKAIKRAKKCISPETMGCFLIWQCIDIKKKNDLSKKTPYDLSWLNDIDFSKKIAYDLKDIEPVDLKAVHKLFPAIELPDKNAQKADAKKAALIQIAREAGASEEPASKENKLTQEKMANKAALLQSLQDETDKQAATLHKPQQFAPDAVLTHPLTQIVHELHGEGEEFDEFEEQEELETPTLWQRVKSWMSWLRSWIPL